MSADDAHPPMTTSVRSFAARLALLIALGTTGLSAGFLFLWNEVMVPGLATVDDVTYIQTMNGVNGVIRNAPFGIAFFGSFLAMLVALSLSSWFVRRRTIALVAAGTALYLLVLVLTFTIHVPMNRDLLELTDLTGIDTAAVRTEYETRWNRWHLPRAYAVLGSFLVLVTATGTELLAARSDSSPVASPAGHRLVR